jgi:hypothetical protein
LTLTLRKSDRTGVNCIVTVNDARRNSVDDDDGDNDRFLVDDPEDDLPNRCRNNSSDDCRRRGWNVIDTTLRINLDWISIDCVLRRCVVAVVVVVGLVDDVDEDEDVTIPHSSNAFCNPMGKKGLDRPRLLLMLASGLLLKD